MGDDQIVAFLPACPPAPLCCLDWRDHAELVHRTQLPPPALNALSIEVAPPSPAPPTPAGYIDPD